MNEPLAYDLENVIWDRMSLDDSRLYLVPRWSFQGIPMTDALRKAFPQFSFHYSYDIYTSNKPIIVEGDEALLSEFERNYIREDGFDKVKRVYIPKDNAGSRYSLRAVTAHDERILTTLYLYLAIPSRRDELANNLRSNFPQFTVMISYEYPDRVAVRGRSIYIKYFIEKYIHNLEHALIDADMYIEVPNDHRELSEDLFKPYLNTPIYADNVRYDQFAKVIVKEDSEMNKNDIKKVSNAFYGYAFNWNPETRYFHPSMVKDVIFNPPATIVFWTDGTKTVVKCTNNEPFDPEKGMLMAIIKHCFNDGSTRTSKWMKKFTEKVDDENDGKDLCES